MKLNDPKNWMVNGDDLGFKEISGSVSIDDIVAASEAMATLPTITQRKISPRAELKQVLGALWSCAVVVRERLLMPADPRFAKIKTVTDQLQDHLQSTRYEDFLNPPRCRAGLPPAN